MHMDAAAAGFLRTWLVSLVLFCQGIGVSRLVACFNMVATAVVTVTAPTARHSLDCSQAHEILVDGGLKCVQVQETSKE